MPDYALYVVLALAAVGLATVAYLLYKGVKIALEGVSPVFAYLGSGPRQMMSFWLYALAVFGGAGLGYGVNEERGMWVGMGVASLVLGGGTVLLYWFRHWVKWSYGEKE